MDSGGGGSELKVWLTSLSDSAYVVCERSVAAGGTSEGGFKSKRTFDSGSSRLLTSDLSEVSDLCSDFSLGGCAWMVESPDFYERFQSKTPALTASSHPRRATYPALEALGSVDDRY